MYSDGLALAMSAGAGGILLDIAVIVVAAKLVGELMERMRQPAVVGELLVGVLLSASLLGGPLGLPDLSSAAHGAASAAAATTTGAPTGLALDAHVLQVLASLGAVILLFAVGLESDVRQLRLVGTSSLLVAAIGVVASFLLGFAASWMLADRWGTWRAADAALPPVLLHVFIGAAFTATSVGITARVLSDMGRLQTAEARTILGAAVLDDVAGLIILAVVGALVAGVGTGDTLDAWAIIRIGALAVAFLLVAVVGGLRVVPRAYDELVDRFKVAGFPVALAVGFALLMAHAAILAGLADIVGAFAAGLVLAQTRHAHRIFEGVKPIAAILVGFFFVTIGMAVDLRAFRGHTAGILASAAVLAVAAVAAKLACGLGVVKGQARRLAVGVGMVPRGEVGLVFALMGVSQGLLDSTLYATVVLVVLATTVATPIWLGAIRDRFTPDATQTEGTDLARVLEA